MAELFQLFPLDPFHHCAVRDVYSDAIESLGYEFYSKEQIQAWSSLAWLPGVLDAPLKEGSGWISYQNQEIQAFAVRYPSNRLALLYSRGKSTRKGHASALIRKIEEDAINEGQSKLITEASFFSYPLFLKFNWKIESIQNIEIAGIEFERFLMQKILV